MLNIEHTGRIETMDYQKAYRILFNGITDALAELGKAGHKDAETARAETILQSIQQQTEDMHMDAD